MKRKYNQHQIAEIMRKREEGEGYGTIGRALGMSRSTVATIVKREKVAVWLNGMNLYHKHYHKYPLHPKKHSTTGFFSTTG